MTEKKPYIPPKMENVALQSFYNEISERLIPAPVSASDHESLFVPAEKQSVLFIFLFNEV